MVSTSSNPCKYMDCYSFTGPGGWEAELADQQWKLYPQSDQLSITDQEQVGERPLVKD